MSAALFAACFCVFFVVDFRVPKMQLQKMTETNMANRLRHSFQIFDPEIHVNS